MTVEPISVPSGVYYMDVSCQLGALNYVLGLRYNSRTDGWECAISDSAGNLILAGMALRSGRNAFDGKYSNPQIPRGALYVYDTTGENVGPSKDSFASTHQLLFITP